MHLNVCIVLNALSDICADGVPIIFQTRCHIISLLVHRVKPDLSEQYKKAAYVTTSLC